MKYVDVILKIIGLIVGLFYVIKLITKKQPSETYTSMDAVVYPFYDDDGYDDY